MYLIIKFRFIINLISFKIIIQHFLIFFMFRINFRFLYLNYLFRANFTKVFIHSNFFNHLIIFYIFLFLTFPFIFNL